MDASETNIGYRIWASDNVVYGPVDLPVLINWIKEERVLADTWVYIDHLSIWKKAGEVPEIKQFFASVSAEKERQQYSGLPFKPSSLRQIRLFSEMSNDQIARFIRVMEVVKVKQWTEVVKQGQLGDAMYLILDGELRVRLMIGGKETILATLGNGEFFGEISLFDKGPRSADVIANKDSTLLKISAESFENLIAQHPELAAPFLFAIGKTLTARIRADNKRYHDSIYFVRMAGIKQ